MFMATFIIFLQAQYNIHGPVYSAVICFPFYFYSEWLHNVPIFNSKCQGFPESPVCILRCCVFPVPQRTGLLVTPIFKKIDFEPYIILVIYQIIWLNPFRQEGWRLEHENPTDPNSPLTFKGIVFNEMKGAFVSCLSFIPLFGVTNVLDTENTYWNVIYEWQKRMIYAIKILLSSRK